MKRGAPIGRGGRCGAWTLVREIGRGAYGVVYFARGLLGKTAAVKVCARDAVDLEHYSRELRGAKLYMSIPPSEGLVRVQELRECAWGFYMVMDLADDEFGKSPSATSEYRPKTLASIIAGEKALTMKESLRLGLALTKGLVTLQRHHLLHRDIKPGNVIYVRGRPVLSDPGLLVEEAEAMSLVGTPGYVPPENFTGAGGDVYSLGLTLKAASFGRPVEDLAMGPTQDADVGHPFFMVWWRILNKATHPDESCRYRSAKALLRNLQVLRIRGISSWKVPFLLEVLIIGLVLWIGYYFLVVVPGGSGSHTPSQRHEEQKAAAREVLDAFVDKRAKEETARAKDAIRKLREQLENVRERNEQRAKRIRKELKKPRKQQEDSQAIDES